MPGRSGNNPWGNFSSNISDKAFLNGSMTLTAPGTVAYSLGDATMGTITLSNGSVSTSNNSVSFDLAYTPGTNPGKGSAGTYRFTGTWNDHAGGPNATAGYTGTCVLQGMLGDGDDWAAPSN